jgi:hypothetical protein
VFLAASTDLRVQRYDDFSYCASFLGVFFAEAVKICYLKEKAAHSATVLALCVALVVRLDKVREAYFTIFFPPTM